MVRFVVRAWQLVLPQQGWGTKTILQPGVESCAALGIGIGLEGNGATLAARELGGIRRHSHHVGGRQLARQFDIDHGGLKGLVLFDERTRLLLPEPEDFAITQRR